MFTGIIEEIGLVKSESSRGEAKRLSITAKKVLEGTKLGDSICVNGVCLTVTDLSRDSFSADVMHETLNRSDLGRLRVGSPVNLERAIRADGRFGGHIVSGHIYGIGRIAKIAQDANALWYYLEAEPALLRYIVEKGSVALDGVSLTVAYVDERQFGVSLIPLTQKETIFRYKSVGDEINIETDIIGKYVEKLVLQEPLNQEIQFPQSNGITEEFLARQGYL